MQFNHNAYNRKQNKFHLQNIHNNASLNAQVLQKEIFETFSKSLPSSNNLETLVKQLADQLSRLDPRGWFQSITHSIGSGAIMLIITLVIIFVIYRCLSTKIVQTKQTQLVSDFFTKASTVTPNYEKIKREKSQGTFNFKGCSMLHFLPLCAISQGLCSL